MIDHIILLTLGIARRSFRMSRSFNRRVRRAKRIGQCVVLIAILLTSGLPSSVRANKKKRRPVVISFGQPNIWSLEQAHYLLARMQSENLDLLSKFPDENALDPNAVNGTRINILK